MSWPIKMPLSTCRAGEMGAIYVHAKPTSGLPRWYPGTLGVSKYLYLVYSKGELITSNGLSSCDMHPYMTLQEPKATWKSK
jgi:hypothetical protein